MAATPHGVFMGTANDYYGATVLRGSTAFGRQTIPAAERLEVEPLKSGAALLSWRPVPPVERTRVFRAERLPVFFRTDLNLYAWNIQFGNMLKDTYIGPYEEIGATDGSYFVDRTVQRGREYMYYVVQEQRRQTSDQSNLVGFPLLTPPMTFTMLSREVDKMKARGRLFNAAGLRATLDAARTAAAYCRIDQAVRILSPMRLAWFAYYPELLDLEIMGSKLERRLTLYRRFPSDMIAVEFCAP
jgi:hypothetical protein